jgi:hypothetical protein
MRRAQFVGVLLFYFVNNVGCAHEPKEKMGLSRAVRLLGSIYMRGSESCMPESRRTVSFYSIQKGHLSTRRSAGKTSVSPSARVWTAPSSPAGASSPSSSRSQGARGQHADGMLPHLSNVHTLLQPDRRAHQARGPPRGPSHHPSPSPASASASAVCSEARVPRTDSGRYRWESVQPVQRPTPSTIKQLSDRVDSSS